MAVVLVLVLVLDFIFFFEDEDDDDEEEEAFRGFSHRLFRRQRQANPHPLPRKRSVPIQQPASGDNVRMRPHRAAAAATTDQLSPNPPSFRR